MSNWLIYVLNNVDENIAMDVARIHYNEIIKTLATRLLQMVLLSKASSQVGGVY